MMGEWQGLTKAKEMLMLGQRYDSASLHEVGVAWRVVEDEQLLAQAFAVALHLAQLPPLSVRAMKRVLNQAAANDMNPRHAVRNRSHHSGFFGS